MTGRRLLWAGLVMSALLPPRALAVLQEDVTRLPDARDAGANGDRSAPDDASDDGDPVLSDQTVAPTDRFNPGPLEDIFEAAQQ